MSLQNLTILGCTGSIGVNTLDVVRRHPDRYRVTALCAHRQADLLFEQCVEFRPRYAVLGDAASAAALQARLAAAGLPALDVEPAELPIALVNRYTELKRRGAI